MNNYNFGNYICSLREKKGLSQKQLGDKLGVSNKAISKWENGGAYPSSELMLPLAKELGISIEELYTNLSNSKTEKTKIRKLLELLAQKSTIVLGGLAVFFAVCWVLFLVFGNAPDKKEVLIWSPILPVIIYGIMRFMFYFIIIKNPMASPKIQDIFAAFFIVASMFSLLATVMNLISAFPNGMISGAGIAIGILGAILHIYRQ